MIITHLSDKGRPMKHVKRMGFDDTFVPQGNRDKLLKRYGLDVEGIIKTVRLLLDET